MNLIEVRHRSVRLPGEDTRIHNMLPAVTASRQRNQKKSTLLEVDSNIMGREVPRQTIIALGWNPKLRRTSTQNNNNGVGSYFSEALQINSARRISMAQEKENAMPVPSKPPTRDHNSRRSRPFMGEQPPKTANYNGKGRQFRVTRHQKHSEFLQVKDLMDWQQDSTQASIKLHRIHPGKIEADNDLHELANSVNLLEMLHPPKSSPALVIIVQLELFLTENSFWAPLKPCQRIKPEARSVLGYLSHHTSVVLLHHNVEVLQEFTQKAAQWKIPVWCTLLMSISGRKQHKFYDLSDVMHRLELLPSCDVMVLDAVGEEPNLQEQALLPLCRSSRIGVILYRTARKAGDCSNISQLLHFKELTLQLRTSEFRSVNPQELVDMEDVLQRLNNHQSLRSIAQIKRQLSATAMTKNPMPSLEEFKGKLTRYIKILQAESTLPHKNQSASFLVGDLLKRNYQIHNQLQNNKYLGAPRHERIVQEISNLEQIDRYSTALYNCTVVLINL